MTFCCETFKNAVEEETVLLIDSYILDREGPPQWKETIENVTRGYYITDEYAMGELGLDRYPALPKIPLKFCPWCGKELEI